MPDIDLERGSFWVPVFLVAQMMVIHFAISGESPPPPPASAYFPAAFGPWKVFRQDPIDSETARELKADLLVSQSYLDPPTRSFASLLVAWYQSQRDGTRQPHSPKVCLPGAGWTPRIADEVTVETAAGVITVNRYVVDQGLQRAVVLYWYQNSRRVIAGEWAAKFWIVADSLRNKRTDTALVRVVAWSTNETDESATRTAAGFARNLYPALREYLPQ
jgi:EpsI family protein